MRVFEIARVVARASRSRCRRRRKFVSAELVAAYRACAACDGFGFVPHTAAPAFDVFYWLQVTNFQVTNFALLNSAPNRADYSHIRRPVLHYQLFAATLIAFSPLYHNRPNGSASEIRSTPR